MTLEEFDKYFVQSVYVGSLQDRVSMLENVALQLTDYIKKLESRIDQASIGMPIF